VRRHLPNLLSLLRLAAAPFAAWAILAGHDTMALIVFVAAGLSDGLDGFIARHWQAVSRLGAWLDPAADKLLMLATYVALLGVAAAPWWLVALVIGRDLAIASVWLTAKLAALPLAFRPLGIGKLSTLLQIAYAGLVLLFLAFDLSAPPVLLAAALLTALVTLLSGGAYLWLFLRGLFARHRIA
jgi:cardiolipin synthase